MSDYQEEVVTNLLGLQAELRGDEPPAQVEKDAATAKEDGEAADGVTVSEQDVAVSSAPAPATHVQERLAALNERLARLELELAGVTKRIDRREPEPQTDTSGETDADPDAPWRSFIDLQRIVADRLDRR